MRMTTANITARTALLILAGALATGCRNGGEPDPEPPVEEAREPRFEGVLMGGFAGIGGEHTGWMLHRENAPALEVDVSAIADRARPLDGERVVVHGEVVERDYLERGPTPVLVATDIEAPK